MSTDFSLAPKPVPDCPPVTAPVVVQYDAVHAAGEGIEPVIIPGPAAGELAPFAGKIQVDGCDSLTLTVTYLTGGDCNNCTTDTITTADVVIDVPAGATYPIPDGYWSAISYVVNGGAGASVDGLHIHMLSACQPNPCCPVVIPVAAEGVIVRG